jgi:hypothetical protein
MRCLMAKRQHKKKRPMAVVRIGELATPERCRQQGGVMTEVVDRDASGKAYKDVVYYETFLKA